MLRSASSAILSHVCRCLIVWTVLAGLSFRVDSARADDPKGKEKPDAPDQPSLFGNEFWEQRGATALIGASFGAAAPLQKTILLEVGNTLHFWDIQPPMLRGEARAPVGASAVLLGSLGAGGPLTALTVLRAGDYLDCWSLADSLGVRALDPFTLGTVRDDLPLPSEQETSVAAVQEAFALNDALLKVLRAPVGSFAKVALLSPTVDAVAAQPQRYRGQVVQFDGVLKRVLRKAPPPLLRRYGVKHLYEVWVLTYPAGLPRPVCVLTPVLPRGIPVADDFAKGPAVTLAGYFFKRYRFPRGDGIHGNPDRSVPLLVGHVSPTITTRIRAGLTAAATVLAGSSGNLATARQLALLQLGERTRCWAIKDPTRVPVLNRTYLRTIKDGGPLPNGLEESERDAQELYAECEALLKADETPAALFLKAVRPDVTFAHLIKEPWRYRGEVVRIDGHLRRVRRWDPMVMVREAKIKDLYEVWLVNTQYTLPNPAVLFCTRLPPGIKVTEKPDANVSVSFVGYFIKKFRYKSADTLKANEFRDAPMLIGRVLPSTRSDRAKDGWTNGLVPVFFGVIAVTLGIVFAMTWFFRRADRRVRDRLDAAAAQFVNTLEPLPPPVEMPHPEGTPSAGRE